MGKYFVPVGRSRTGFLWCIPMASPLLACLCLFEAHVSIPGSPMTTRVLAATHFVNARGWCMRACALVTHCVRSGWGSS